MRPYGIWQSPSSSVVFVDGNFKTPMPFDLDILVRNQHGISLHSNDWFSDSS